MSENDSYKHILKSTGIIGGSQIVVILIGIVRTKVIALILGPLGYGISSSLQATIDMMRQATGFGLNYSAVREISQNAETGDAFLISKIVTILKRWAIYTGILGTIVTILFCFPLSQYAFDNKEYAWSIALISIILLLTSVSTAQVAILQGFRLLKLMAISSIWGALVGTVIVIPLYFILGVDGIVPALIITALGTLLVTWLYSRKVKVKKIPLTFVETFKGGLGMVKLGFFLVITSFIVTLIMYSIRAFIVRKLNMDAVGCFQSAWNVSNIYIGIVLNAMGADFFPRLSAIHTDNIESNKLINQQLEMVVLIISPLLIFMIAGADIIIQLLYSAKFYSAVPLLQWQLAGGLFSVISWCLGVSFLAKNKGHYALITEIIWGTSYLLFVILSWDKLGFISLGVGYFVTSVIKAGIVIGIVHRMGKFKFSKKVLKNTALFMLLVGLILVNIYTCSGIIQYFISLLIVGVCVLYSYKKLNNVMNIKDMILKFLKRK